MSELLSQLQALELELHHPGVHCSRGRLEQLLHPHFHEVGRSGCAYTRDTIINYLAVLDAPPAVRSDAFIVDELSSGVALLSFRSAQVAPDCSLTRHTLRSSLWIQSASGWQLRYHQGTPAAEGWLA
ncbi:DUF4440 domain-containing protein [Synechococcus sp. ATX 2A4]|nr:DUF4440 domain-containing protein [Synechococcus sp. ATX 2A4]